MTDNEKAPIDEGIKNSNFIIPQKVTENNVVEHLPSILKNTVVILKNKFFDTFLSCLLGILLVKIAQMINSKRIKFNECGKLSIPNIFIMNFMPSGYGKDAITDDIDDLLLKNFILWFKNKAKKFFSQQEQQIENEANELYPSDKEENRRQAFIKDEKNKIRKLVIEITNATKEGFYFDALTFKNADFGSLFIKISEFGTYLYTLTQNIQNREFVDSFNEAYNGKICGKCTKSDVRLEDVEDIPVNILLHSDYTLILQDLKNLFVTLLQTGLGRRSIITFQPQTPLRSLFTAEQLTQYRKKLEQLGEALHKIFMQIPSNAVYVIDYNAYNKIIYTYKAYLNDFYNTCEDELLKKEIKSRELKVLKLSCLYAALNHPTEFLIDENDLIQAVYTIQYLSKDFKACINYKSYKRDEYDRLLDFFIENMGKKFKKTELTYRHYKEFNLSRNAFIKNFDEIMQNLKEYATVKGYSFCIENGSNNATECFLLDNNQSLNNGELPLNQIISESDETR